MDKEQAQQQAQYLNSIIEDYIAEINYVVFAYWNTQYQKLYATVLIPSKYNDNYNVANDSVKLSFARVALKTLVQDYRDSNSYVTLYDENIPSDSELNNYLNPKP